MVARAKDAYWVNTQSHALGVGHAALMEEPVSAKRLRALRKTLTIDPGWFTAVAEWQGSLMPMMHIIGLPKHLKGKDADWGEQLKHMASQFMNVLERVSELGHELETVIIEGVEMWEGSLTSMTSARRGDTFRLASLAGAYAGVAGLAGYDVIILTPKQWKGQLTKEATMLRVQRKWEQYCIEAEEMSEHEWDAIALGFACMGEL
jgi:hypothetical protein